MADWADKKTQDLADELWGNAMADEHVCDVIAAALREIAAEWYQRGAGDIAAILGPGEPAVLVGNLVIERDRLLLLLKESEKREQTAYQRGAEDMRERAAQLADDYTRGCRERCDACVYRIEELPLVADETETK